MSNATQEAGYASAVLTESEREQIRSQLARLLESPLFRNSRRYPALLRFLVEETLEGRGDLLKERLIGIHVFDRPAHYDTASDPVVRVTVAEIRKRIAQYYHDEEHDAELRIEMLTGRYAPEFRFKSAKGEPAGVGAVPPTHHESVGALEQLLPTPPEVHVPPSEVHVPHEAGKLPRSFWRGLSGKTQLSLGAGLLVLLGLAAALALVNRSSAVDELWRPLLASPRPLLICIPTGAGTKLGPASISDVAGRTDENRTFLEHEALGENVVYSDTLAAIHAATILALRHQDFRVKLNTITTFDDLRQSPAVLIGGLDNQWTMETLAPLRFHFTGNADGTNYWITDRQHPNNTEWALDLRQRVSAVTRDYAIVARVHSEQTSQNEMVIAGIGMSGTAAAGEFMADERRIRELRQALGPAFGNRDFEAVLSMDVINGVAGSPKIVAVYSW